LRNETVSITVHIVENLLQALTGRSNQPLKLLKDVTVPSCGRRGLCLHAHTHSFGVSNSAGSGISAVLNLVLVKRSHRFNVGFSRVGQTFKIISPAIVINGGVTLGECFPELFYLSLLEAVRCNRGDRVYKVFLRNVFSCSFTIFVKVSDEVEGRSAVSK
jgi:hypothetical protein